MEYYAKSKKKQLSAEEQEKRRTELLDVKEALWEELGTNELHLLDECIKNQGKASEKEEKQKTLQEHQKDIVQCAERFFEEYGQYFSEKEKELILEACRIHDWGKANRIFQAMLNPELAPEQQIKAIKQIPHGYLSAVTVSKKELQNKVKDFTEEDFRAFITSVYHHHAREDGYEGSDIRKYGEKYYLREISEYLGQEKTKLYCSNMGSLLFRNNGYSGKFICDPAVWNEYLLIKGMLNKFDYAVSAGYEEAEIECDIKEKRLKKRIENFLEGKTVRPAQQFMKDHSRENLIMVAPTGSGKTEAALLWLNGEKGFYTLPLKVSSNAIYFRIKENYGYKNAAILHSDSMAMYLREDGEGEMATGIKQERAKMLAKPITVCTIDQLFKFVYKALGTEIFAATLKYSKLIIDEIQSYDPQSIAIIIHGLKTIYEMDGRFAIITATFPPVLKYFLEQNGLIQGKQYQFADFTGEKSTSDRMLRHKIKIRPSEMDLDEIADQGKKRKVLVICNTVSRAQKIYGELLNKNECVHLLHSRFIRRDRNLLERAIMDFSESDEAGIWVTTQIVEASLDIDFDVLYTEMCTADSLLQRLGRCNRKGRYYPEEVNVFVYDNRNGVGENSIYEPDLYERSLKILEKYEETVFTEEQKTKYMSEVYDIEAIKKTKYFKKIQECLERFAEIPPAEYSLQEAEVRDIKSITVVPDKIYEENQKLFEEGVSILRQSHTAKEVKDMIRIKFQDLTLGINLKNCFGLPDGIDRITVGEKDGRKVTDIHRTQFKYEFDLIKKTGKGLILGEKQDSENIFL